MSVHVEKPEVGVGVLSVQFHVLARCWGHGSVDVHDDQAMFYDVQTMFRLVLLLIKCSAEVQTMF